MAIVIVRTIIVYFTLLITMRIMGKRQLGEMELSEFVVAALIADMAAHPLQDIGIPMINGLIPILTLFCCEVILAGLSMKSVKIRSVLFGKPSMLIVRGKINQSEMLANRFTVDELMQELRNQSISDISKIEYAILETDGQLNVIPFPSEKPPTSSQLGINVSDGGYPTIVINEGRILSSNLKQLGLDDEWLKEELNAKGCGEPETIYLMTVNRAGESYISRKEIQNEA